MFIHSSHTYKGLDNNLDSLVHPPTDIYVIRKTRTVISKGNSSIFSRGGGGGGGGTTSSLMHEESDSM